MVSFIVCHIAVYNTDSEALHYAELLRASSRFWYCSEVSAGVYISETPIALLLSKVQYNNGMNCTLEENRIPGTLVLTKMENR